MVGQAYLRPLQDYQFDLHSEKVNSIARLIKLQIPTVPLPHVLLPSSFEFYRKKQRLASQAEKELVGFFNLLQKAGYPATVRPSIFADWPGAEFIVANSVNLPTLAAIKTAIIAGYDQVLKEFGQAVKIEFAHLLQGFYTANKALVVYSEDGTGLVYIGAAFGEHTRILTREGAIADVYKINKKTGQIQEKQIAAKEFTLEPGKIGLRKVKLTAAERTQSVLTDKEIKQIYQYALQMEKAYGPQEIEAAVLRTGQVIFQSSRDSQVKKQPMILVKNLPIFSKAVQGEIIKLSQLADNLNLKGKIVITDNLEIDFITKLVHQFKPKGVILTRGSLTAHAVTILREAKIPSVLASGLTIAKEKFCQIKANAEINPIKSRRDLGGLIVTLDDKPDRQLTGGKAFNLAKLKKAGFNVPGACVVTTLAQGKMDHQLKKGIAEHLKSLKDSRFAVRSSATVEDSASASFAGQMESYLSTPASAIFTTVEQCWQSLKSERVRLYCQRQQINPAKIKMAVIIQEMIFAEKGGVIFTENIFQDHQDELMMEAAQGLGEKVVSGLVNPERIIVKKTSRQIVSRHLVNGPILTNKEITQLVEIALKVEALYGCAQDIEWAMMKNKIYILQSRPITK